MFASGKTAAVSSEANYIEDVFSTYLYTGNGSTQTITNGIDLAGEGGLVWIKDRTTGGTSYENALTDTVRGATNEIQSDTTAAQTTNAARLTSFNSNGFSIGNSVRYNQNADNYASWTFRKQPKFFDVVTYTGNGTTQNIAHNLGSVPGCIIVKEASAAGNDWQVYHRSTTNTCGRLFLNLTNAENANGRANTWGDNTNPVPPTSTVFTVGNTGSVNNNGATFVAYLFAHDAGGFGLTGTDNVISCGSLTSSGSGGATVTLNYEAQWILLKNTSAAENWILVDTMRGMSFSSTPFLKPNLSDAEGSLGAGAIVPTATGFTVANGVLSNSNTYIYIAIRRGPMKVPTSGTSVYNGITRTGTGSGSAQITGVGFSPDAVIGFGRTASVGTAWYDRLRGKELALRSALTNAEYNASPGGEGTFSMDGVQVEYLYGILNSATTYINWFFRRAPGFFDEVCYTGTGTTQNITHNLGVVPELWIVKKRSSGTNRPWRVGTGNGTTYMALNSIDASTSFSDPWNDTAPTASVFTVGIENATNESSATFVAYLFATCAGVSKVGSYTGTGTTKQIDCGFTGGARFVLIKRTDSTGDWYVWDSARGIVAGNDPYLLLNSTAAEVTNTDYVDTYSAGFEISSTAPAAINASGGTFIFLAIA